MTLFPITPSVVKELIVEPDDSLRVGIVKVYVKFAVIVYRVFKWAFTDDGEATPELKAWVCENCEAAKLKAETPNPTISATATATVNT